MSAMDWDDVRVFLEIEREGSLSGAARKLKIDQTTAGRRLAALETALSARLFDRVPEGLNLTPAGLAIRDAALGMEQSAFELARRVGGVDANLGGSVRVATSEAFAVRFLIGALAKVKARHPDIALELAVGFSSVDLARREADIAVRFRPNGTPPAQPNLVSRKVGEIAFALYASKMYLERAGVPDTSGAFAGHDVIGYDDDGARTHFIHEMLWRSRR
jgi:DNA-binding transcriptional LysR family regulator